MAERSPDGGSARTIAPNWSPDEPRQRVARLQVARQAAGDGEQGGVAHRQAEGIVDPLEAVDVDGEHRRRRRARLLRQVERRRQPVLEQLAVGKAGQIVVDGVVEHALLGRLDFGDVRQRADHAHDLSVGADHRPRLQHVPEIVAVGAAQPQIVVDPAGALMQEPVERQGVAVAVERMEDVEPAGGRPLERIALEAELAFERLGAADLVVDDVPVEDRLARTGHGEGTPFGVGAEFTAPRPAPEKANCITVKPISMTISTRPPTRPGAARSLVR